MLNRLIAAALMLAAAVPAAAGNVTLRFSNWLPPEHYVVTEMIRPWAEDVAEATDGRVTVEIMQAMAKPEAHFDLVRDGVADLAFGVHGYTPARFKLTGMAELPLLADDAEANSVAYWRTYQRYFRPANEHEGVKLLSLWTNTPAQIFLRGGDVAGVGDLSGRKVRVLGATTGEVAQRLGMTPISAPASQSYELLSRGVIDGTFFQSDSIVSFRLQDYVDTAVTVPGGFAHSSQYLVMNRDKWNAISKADREAIEALSGEAMARRFARVWDRKAREARETLRGAGVRFVRLDGDARDRLAERLAPVRADWVETAAERGVDGEAALAYFHDQIEALNAE
ncbi:Outer membrane transporter protein TsaT [wastewater metagenome]|uniref:Outer membrane transporter protein TsaT n=2 Tax=unclassified sequences TaxID=12908 RepID=A0A5B8RG15_9ZZZZ|nr:MULTISPECIES: TRAP transporter substrate-binding protein [Arhodomonas]MCS4503978.1 TRAP transporter substrate-binding protein [Arhodomonas aquaeolei]QEA06798.1 outer membrane transporter protein TsaT [uncultured organism]